MIFLETKEESQFHIQIGGTFEKPFLCPNCHKNLTRAATIPTELVSCLFARKLDHPINLFCCWRCNLMLDHFVYSFASNNYEILSYRSGNEDGVFHLEIYPDEFPEFLVNVKNPTPREYKTIAKLSELLTRDSIDYQVALSKFEGSENLSLAVGEFFPHPYGEEFSSCPQCADPNPVIACIPGTIGDADFTGNRYVFMIFIICRECMKVTCTHIVD